MGQLGVTAQLIIAAAATALLVGCGQGGSMTNDAAPSANTVAPVSAAAPAPEGDRPAGLVGRWGRNSECPAWIEFRADGGVAMSHQQVASDVRWFVRDGILRLGAPGEEERAIGSVKLEADRLEMTHPETGAKGPMVRCQG